MSGSGGDKKEREREEKLNKPETWLRADRQRFATPMEFCQELDFANLVDESSEFRGIFA